MKIDISEMTSDKAIGIIMKCQDLVSNPNVSKEELKETILGLCEIVKQTTYLFTIVQRAMGLGNEKG